MFLSAEHYNRIMVRLSFLLISCIKVLMLSYRNVYFVQDHHMKMIWYMIVESINVKTFFRSQRWKLSATSHVAKFYNAYWACRVKTYRWKPLSYISFFLYISRVILLLQTQVYINKKSVKEKLFVKNFQILSLTWQWMNRI